MAAVGLLLAVLTPDSGYIAVRSSLPGIAVYLEGEYLGRTPIEREPLAAGSYLVSVASEDSLEQLYLQLRRGGVGRKLSSVWSLAAIDAGTQEVEIKPGRLSEVTIDYGRVLGAPGRAKCLAGCAFGGLFGLGAVLGALIAHFAF